MRLVCLCLLVAASCNAIPLTNAKAGFEHDYETAEHTQSTQRLIKFPEPAAVADTALVLPEDEDSEHEPLLDAVLTQTSNTHAQVDDITAQPAAKTAIPHHLVNEPRYTPERAPADGRDAMKPDDKGLLDEDCDSPQIGESEAWPQPPSTVNMNDANQHDASMTAKLAGEMREQSEEREVLEPQHIAKATKADDPSAMSSDVTTHVTGITRPIEADDKYRTEALPKPDAEQVKKSKCSRSINGNDVPDPLHVLDDDCGMPEPEIACETQGNSTLCVPRIQLGIPPIPQAELMPPVPPNLSQSKRDPEWISIAVEFVDFGETRQVLSHVSNSVGRVIEEAGVDFLVDSWAVQLVRSGGFDVSIETIVDHLPDEAQVVVYLICTHRRLQPKLLVPITACEDLIEKKYNVRIEIPAFEAVYDVVALSIETVKSAVIRAPINLEDVEQVTYDGRTVNLDDTLLSLHFKNNSALIIYHNDPCPSQTTSPSNSPSPLPSVTPSPTPNSNPMTDAIARMVKAENEQFAKLDVPEFNHDIGRFPMTHDANILVRYEGRTFPVLIKPIARGIDIFDAVERVTGKRHIYLLASFLDRVIDHYTALRPFGFVDGDIVDVKSMQYPQEHTTPQ